MHYSFRPLKLEYLAVAKLLEADLYLKMDEQEFIKGMLRYTNGSITITRARKIYYDLMKDAGI